VIVAPSYKQPTLPLPLRHWALWTRAGCQSAATGLAGPTRSTLVWPMARSLGPLDLGVELGVTLTRQLRERGLL